MKTLRLSIGYIMLVMLFACAKDPDSTPPATEKKRSLSLNFKANSPDNKWEFIVSTVEGKIILDTIANANTQSIFEFYTNEKKLDLTFIYYDAAEKKFKMGTFRDVDPSDWDNLETPVFGHLNFNKPGPTSPPTRAKIHYLNPPPYTGSPYFYPNSFTLIKNTTSTITTEYSRRKDVPAYLLLPEQGYCKIYLPKSDNDTIDLSGMEKAARIPFDFSTSQTASYAILYGITDTTDRSKDVELFNYSITPKIPDLLYPAQPFQKYDLLVGATSTSNEFFGLYSYDDTIPKVYKLLTSADYSISSSNADNFSIAFPGQKTLYYMTQWTNSELDWQVYAPVNLNQARYMEMLNKMKNKLLAGTNTNTIKLGKLIMEKSGNIDYAKLLSRSMIFAERTKTPDLTTVLYVKTF